MGSQVHICKMEMVCLFWTPAVSVVLPPNVYHVTGVQPARASSNASGHTWYWDATEARFLVVNIGFAGAQASAKVVVFRWIFK